MKKRTRKVALSRETLRHLDEVRLRQTGAAELTGTATFTCQDHTCGNCVTADLTSCRCTPVI